MRRLPVYLLLDTSGSMHGEPIEAVKNGVQTLLTTLKQDPYALETAYVSVITFDSSARQAVPLTDLLSFQMPALTASGTTSLGEALTLTASSIAKEVQKTTADTKGDWRPLVFLMTDGSPNDDWRKGAYSALFDHGLASKSDQRFASIRSTGNLTFSTAF